MPIVTVTSDWKDSSYYLPVLKGRLLSLFSEGKAGKYGPGDLHVENLCSSVEPFNIPQGCFILRNSYRSFPKGTIHLMAVDSEPAEGVEMVAVQYAGHWFVTPNDGRFSLLAPPAAAEGGEAVGYAIPLPDKFSTFMACDLFAEAVSAICRGSFASEFKVCALKSVAGGMPAIMEDRIIGKVVYAYTTFPIMRSSIIAGIPPATLFRAHTLNSDAKLPLHIAETASAKRSQAMNVENLSGRGIAYPTASPPSAAAGGARRENLPSLGVTNQCPAYCTATISTPSAGSLSTAIRWIVPFGKLL